MLALNVRGGFSKANIVYMTNQNKKFRSFKSKENVHKNEDGPDCTVSNNKFLPVTLLYM